MITDPIIKKALTDFIEGKDQEVEEIGTIKSDVNGIKQLISECRDAERELTNKREALYRLVFDIVDQCKDKVYRYHYKDYLRICDGVLIFDSLSERDLSHIDNFRGRLNEMSTPMFLGVIEDVLKDYYGEV